MSDVRTHNLVNKKVSPFAQLNFIDVKLTDQACVTFRNGTENVVLEWKSFNEHFFCSNNGSLLVIKKDSIKRALTLAKLGNFDNLSRLIHPRLLTKDNSFSSVRVIAYSSNFE